MPRAKIKDIDRGFKKLAESLGEMGAITIGVQGKDVDRPHPNGHGQTVGDIARMHELGLGTQKKRSFCVAWIDENAARMRKESARQLAAVLKGTITRNKALIKLGYSWTEDMRNRVWAGHVQPPIAQATIDKKGDDRALVETITLHDAITYKVWLPQFKSIRDPAQREAARKK